MATTKRARVSVERESGRRLARVMYLENLRSFVIQMEDGRGYVLAAEELPELDASGIVAWRLGPGRQYFSVVQESGNRLEVPWDAVLYHCEPAYEYYKEREKREPDLSRAERIGERVRVERKRRGMTAGQLAEQAGMQRPNLSRLEHGRHEPALEPLGSARKQQSTEHGDHHGDGDEAGHPDVHAAKYTARLARVGSGLLRLQGLHRSFEMRREQHAERARGRSLKNEVLRYVEVDDDLGVRGEIQAAGEVYLDAGLGPARDCQRLGGRAIVEHGAGGEGQPRRIDDETQLGVAAGGHRRVAQQGSDAVLQL